ncbi:GTPase Era [Ferrovum sp. PN-J185]|uniref:GTPase Era n=1 Tax=Ferrovum sp. PN-J185 TaxID=1356306 RepID=UPI001E2C73FA|nr:GTPase Era [Ferrovum sp. PN-J185]MCC6069305.1 GTPase Era [Ferrovum sp. PN-J185]
MNNDMTNIDQYRCGSIAIVGRPNVGKSTLLNHLIGQKISITSRKAQTTRHRLRGFLTTEDCQYIFIDTPGYQNKYTNILNRSMNRSVTNTLIDADVILIVIDKLDWTYEDEIILSKVKDKKPILIINKIDLLKDKHLLLPFIEKITSLNLFSSIVPLSAQKDKAFASLLNEIKYQLPYSPPFFPEDDITDAQIKFLTAEFIREQLFRFLGDELPYATTVVIDKFEEIPNLTRIYATILVNNANQKAIVIGNKGDKLKEIGMHARLNIEKLISTKVYLELWVKVKSGWADNETSLKQLGYEV